MKKEIKVIRRFCEICGRKMEKNYVDPYYDKKTGQQRFDIVWKCSKGMWNNWGEFVDWREHSEFRTNYDGSKIFSLINPYDK